MARVSIGMPVYNGERFIRCALDSLLSQTYTDLELVISDNASTDGTEAICREYEARDKRVQYFRNPHNLGGPANFRRVFHLCRGEYHKWSTADDYCDATVVAKCVAVLDQNPDVVLAYPKTRLEDESGNLLREYEDHLHLQDDSPSARFMTLVNTAALCHAHLGVIRREAVSRTRMIGNEVGSDVRFLAELSLYGKFTVVPEFLFHRRFHEESSSWDRQSMERQRRYYDPQGHSLFALHTWRRYLHLAGAVVRAPIGAREKRILLSYIGRKARWDRARLWREVKALTNIRVGPRRATPGRTLRPFLIQEMKQCVARAELNQAVGNIGSANQLGHPAQHRQVLV
jgi:glycosyltransferase involved in cell wall biosynthesis